MIRTARTGGRYSTSSFDFINESPWESAANARRTLEGWFDRIPADKQKHLRGHFRGDDRAHSGALLELLSHQILLKLCRRVIVAPETSEGAPDFSALYGNTPMIVECTVAQESDKKFGALRRERTVLDVIDSVDVGPYVLMVEPQQVGSNQPPRKRLTRHLEMELQNLVATVAPGSYVAGQMLGHSIIWEWQDWKLCFRVIIRGNNSTAGSLGGIQGKAQWVVDDQMMNRALERKSEAYKQLHVPYLIVVALREGMGNEESLKDALFGPEELLLPDGPGQHSIRQRTLNGFFGSPNKPRNRHVSAILYKWRLRDAWSIRNQRMAYDPDSNSSFRPPDWTLVHHPEASNPLPEGIFPFAVEHVWRSGTSTRINPTTTLNSVLGLPDWWPGEEH